MMKWPTILTAIVFTGILAAAQKPGPAVPQRPGQAIPQVPRIAAGQPPGNAAEQTPRHAVTRGSVTIGNSTIAYQATVQETFLPLESDSVIGSVITTSYEVRTADVQDRPVLFLFNGGPGASSSPLHLYAFGPVRLKKGADSTTQVNNQYSLLDVADLVFIDPMGTGFTQVFNEVSAQRYWDVQGDALAVIDIIKHWKKQHNRLNAPVFICGESYGTVRAAEMVSMIDSFPINGVLLFSATLDNSLMAPVTGNNMPYVLSLPSMAALAWYHHKANASLKSPQQVFDSASAFSQDEYMRALFKGNRLTQVERMAIAQKLSGLTGISEEVILDHDLRLNSSDFEMLVLASENRRIGKLDGRITALVPPIAKPYDSRDDPSLKVNTVLRGDLAGRYFRQRLGFPDTSVYRGVNFVVNGKWQWKSMEADFGYYSALPGLEQAMQSHPQLRLFVAGGVYDLATPLAAAGYLLQQSRISTGRSTFMEFPTGHSIFEDEAQLAKLSTAVKEFISGQ
jgi:carboxypeptidase C (cathepsin A)